MKRTVMMKQTEQNDLWLEERRLWEQGFSVVCGADEAGAGPLAGPVYAAAVVLPRDLKLDGLNDSKKLTAKKRDLLFDEICAAAVSYAITAVSAEEIDAIDILNARIKAMNAAIEALEQAPDMALIDGNRDHGSQYAIACPHMLLIKGDGRSANIAAASILAKVSRDRYMDAMAETYPEYAFDRHKGYGTRLHYQALDRFGPCPIHRKSFLKKWEAQRHDA